MIGYILYSDPIFHHQDASGTLAHDFHYSYYAGTNRLRETGPFLEDRVYTGGRVLSNSKIYRRITVRGNSYVPQGAPVELRATEGVFMEPQFRAAAGRNFRARIVRDEDMYRYDAIGNLILDQAEGTKITWTPYGKVRTVSAQSDTVVTTFRYDGAGNRIEKRVVTNDTLVAITRYLRDASGNVMAIYQDSTLHEQPIYGSSRLGQYQGGAVTACLTLGTRRYELSNHLGNVLTVITDNIGMSADTTWATVVSASDYYPFGLTMEGRNYQDSLYRYGFNGKEKDDQGEWGSTNYDYGFRIYSPEIGKFLSVDPLTSSYPWLTPYQFASNRPIIAVDLDGLESDDKGGQIIDPNIDKKTNEAWDGMPVIPALQKTTEKTVAEGTKNALRQGLLKSVGFMLNLIFLRGDTQEPDWERESIEVYERILRKGEQLDEWSEQHYIELKAKKDGVFLTKEDLRNRDNWLIGPEEQEIIPLNEDDSELKPLTADEIISNEKKGSIRSVFPEEFLDKTLDEINEITKEAGERGRKAKTAQKLLKDKRFDKGDNRK